MLTHEETFVPHVGWLAHEPGDDVGRYLREGWFEYLEQAMWWLYLREGDCVIDCGAHVGLFTLLAARCVGDAGRVIAVEPNPHTASLLRRNVDGLAPDDRAMAKIDVVQAAAAAGPGSIVLHAGAGPAAAYSSAVAGAAVKDAERVHVAAMTIDHMLAERGIARVDMLKIDVEGAERDVWRGCSRSAAERRLPLVMVEFTEANQRAAGSSTREVCRAWEADGYAFHRFGPRTLRLEPAQVAGEISYENLFAARPDDLIAINQRLDGAAPGRQRIARDVLARGEAAFGLLRRALDAEHYRDQSQVEGVTMQGLIRELADVNRRLVEAIKRGDAAEEQATLMRRRVRAYAQFVHETVSSRPMRLLYALRLARPPSFQEMQSDLDAGGQ